jgi:hypothetical protein
MAYNSTIPVISGLAILATFTGVSLGRSAVAEINPIHFRAGNSHFYSDLVPYRSSGSVEPNVAADDYFQPEPAYAVATACRGCDDYPVAYQPRHDKAVDGDLDDWSATRGPEADLASAEKAVPEPPPANRQWIERYTTYTVETETIMAPTQAPDPAQPVVQES